MAGLGGMTFLVTVNIRALLKTPNISMSSTEILCTVWMCEVRPERPLCKSLQKRHFQLFPLCRILWMAKEDFLLKVVLHMRQL